MIAVEDIEDTWTVLSGVASSGDELRVRELPEVGRKMDSVLFALDAAGQRHVLIEVGPRDVVSEDRASSGVHVLRHCLLDGHTPRVFVDLVCRKPHLHAAFSRLVAEVLAAWNAESLPPDKICAEVLDRWREMLERGASGPLSAQQLLGLFGELFVLRQIVRRSPTAFTAWKGPLGWRHDFAHERLAIEVKTASSGEWTCEINGIEQLVPPPGGDLFLFVLQVQRDPNAESLDEIISDICDAGVDRSAVTALLDAVGFRESATAGSELRARVVGMRAYSVDGDFPRVVPGDLVEGHLRHGVLKVRYQLDLNDGVTPHLDESEISHVVDRLSEGFR